MPVLLLMHCSKIVSDRSAAADACGSEVDGSTHQRKPTIISLESTEKHISSSIINFMPMGALMVARE